LRFDAVEKRQGAAFLNLQSLLCKPPGRLAYYKVMIKEYIKTLYPTDSGYDEVQTLLFKISKILARLSAATPEEDKNRKQIKQVFLKQQSGVFVDFLKPGRLLVKEGYLKVHKKKLNESKKKFMKKSERKYFFFV